MITVGPSGPRVFVRNLEARMPFRYGIATMTSLPHVFVVVECEVDGRRAKGISADHLAPKWFTKDPTSSYRDDIGDMLRVIQGACALAAAAPPCASVFDLWKHLYAAQGEWAGRAYPPLLWHFGVSLVERAVIDAFCRAAETTFPDALRGNDLGIRPGEVHPELADLVPSDLLPAETPRSLIVRHTVGLSDPLTEEEIPARERVNDGLPQSLEACISAYGLTHFKVKIGGDEARDLPRLRRIAEVIAGVDGPVHFTLDGNEQYRSVEQFRTTWRRLQREEGLSFVLERLLFVEQPLHREVALSGDVGAALLDWGDRPPIIIDESDGGVGDLPAALEGGYSGTSHKNCKGVIKGVVNACLLEHRRRQQPEGRYIMTGEDLSNVGPIALPQDLAAVACLGIGHVERNGHHYFAGLSMYSEPLQARIAAAHPDLYRRNPRGFVTLDIQDGRVAIGSVLDAPFGYGFEFDPSVFTPAEAWRFDSLGLADG